MTEGRDRIVSFRPLLGFSMEPEVVVLENDVRIRPMDARELDYIVEGDRSEEVKAVYVEPHDIAVVYEVPAHPDGDTWTVEDPAESVLCCLRILKTGLLAGAELVDVVFSDAASPQDMDVHQGITPKWGVLIPWSYDLAREEVDALRSLWRDYRTAIVSRKPWFREAVFRFGESYERMDDYHRATELIIALETTLPMRNQNVTRRIQTASMITSEDPKRRSETRAALERIYGVRNSVVHGYVDANPKAIDPHDLILVEDCVRRCLRQATVLLANGIDWKLQATSNAQLVSWRSALSARLQAEQPPAP